MDLCGAAIAISYFRVIISTAVVLAGMCEVVPQVGMLRTVIGNMSS